MKNDMIRRMAEIMRLMDLGRSGDDYAMGRAIEQQALWTGDLNGRHYKPGTRHYDYHAALDDAVEGVLREETMVFVYGTLKRKHGNHQLLKRATYYGTCRVDGYGLIDGVIPYAERRDGHHVMGELYHVTGQSVMDSLDRLEGYPYHYGRDYVTATLEGGSESYGCWMYVGQQRSTHELVSEWSGWYA